MLIFGSNHSYLCNIQFQVHVVCVKLDVWGKCHGWVSTTHIEGHGASG